MRVGVAESVKSETDEFWEPHPDIRMSDIRTKPRTKREFLMRYQPRAENMRILQFNPGCEAKFCAKVAEQMDWGNACREISTVSSPLKSYLSSEPD